MVNITCTECGKSHGMSDATHRMGVWRGQTEFYCSLRCVGLSQRKTVSFTCSNCNVSVTRKQASVKKSKSGEHFCSTRCSNIGRVRLRKPRSCTQCGESLNTQKRTKVCTNCASRTDALQDQCTKGELFSRRKTWQSARSFIQKTARAKFLRINSEPVCAVCGYQKHVEVCHRRDVADFPDTATIREINDTSNLIGLCPTHHWEFDSNQMDDALLSLLNTAV